jgi:aminoglycoside phosphotransferase (APT) family kinase protein
MGTLDCSQNRLHFKSNLARQANSAKLPGMAEADRRHPYRPFDESLIREFLASRPLASASLITEGKSNTNYLLRLGSGERFLLRLHSHPESRARESFIMDLARKVVPVPAELAHGDGWTILEFVEGLHLLESPQDTAAAAEAMAHLHSITFRSSGWIEADGTISPFPFGGKDFVTIMLRRDDVRQWLSPAIVKSLVDMVAYEAANPEDNGEPPCLVHGDFNPTNILVHDGRVVAVLDWEFSHSGTPYMDIGNLMRNTDPKYHSLIESGLRAGGTKLPQDWECRAARVDLGSHLEFLTTQRSDDFKRLCVRRIEQFAKRFLTA